MKTIKKYWAIIVGSIVAAFGIAIAINKKTTVNVVKKLDKKIDDNNQKVDIISGKVDQIETQKTEVKTDITTLETEVIDLEDKKENIKIDTPTTAKQAKTNILNKTNKKKKK
jgi:TolA-binding protein